MMSRPLLVMLPLFAAGAGAGWRWSNPSLSAGRQRHGAVPTAHAHGIGGMASGEAIRDLPMGSGLRGDWSHLNGITDVRTLRGVWEKSDYDGREILIARWLKVDPADGLRFLGSERVHGAPRDAGKAAELAAEWARKDPIACFQFLKSASQDFVSLFDRRSPGVAGLTTAQLSSDPKQVQAAWKAAGPELRLAMAPVWIGHLLTVDPVQGARELRTLPAGTQSQCWANFQTVNGAGAALNFLREHPEIACLPDAVAGMMEGFVEEDPEAAQSMAEKLPPGTVRENACIAVLRNMQEKEKDPSAILAWVERHAPTRENLEMAYRGMIIADPERGLALYAQHPIDKPEFPSGCFGASENRSGLGNYVQDLAKTDWAAALALADRKDAGDAFRSEVLGSMVSSLSFRDENPVPQLNKLSETLTGKGVRGEYISRILFAHMPYGALRAATAWLGGQPADVQELLLPVMANRIRSPDSASDAALLSQLPESGARTENLMRSIASWAANDPQSAAEFSMALPPGTDHDYAVLNAAMAWGRHDPGAARQWADSLPESSAKTRAVKELEALAVPAP